MVGSQDRRHERLPTRRVWADGYDRHARHSVTDRKLAGGFEDLWPRPDGKRASTWECYLRPLMHPINAEEGCEAAVSACGCAPLWHFSITSVHSPRNVLVRTRKLVSGSQLLGNFGESFKPALDVDQCWLAGDYQSNGSAPTF